MEIQINNIECKSPNGKIYYTHFTWLETFIRLLKAEMKEGTQDFRETLSYRILGYTNGVVKHKEDSTKMKVKEYKAVVLDNSYFSRLKIALEEEKEVEIKGWKFKLV